MEGPGFKDKLLYALQLPLLGPREAKFRRVRRWVEWLAHRQAAAWGTSVEAFRQRHCDPRRLCEETELTDAQVGEYSHRNKVDSGTVAVMQKLVTQYSLSRSEGKAGSKVWAPAMIALALFGLDRSPRERDWRFLLFSALNELVRQRGASDVEWDIRVALDAAYIVMLYFHLGPSAQAAARFASSIQDELIQLRVEEAEEHFLQSLHWK